MKDAATLFEAWKEQPAPETLIALLRQHQDSVYNLCWQVLRHTQDAEDAAQKVFAALLPVLPTLSGDDGLRAWLYRASLLTALNLRRSQRRRMNHERQRSPSPAPPFSDSEIDAIHEQVAQLRDDLRSLVVRHYFERRTLAELAETDGCSSVTIWKRLQKAHDELRRTLVKAGLASVALALLPFLESREAVAAPAQLLSALPLPRSGSAAAAAAPAAGLLAVKVAVAVALLGTALLGYGIQRRRHNARLEESPVARSAEPPAPSIAPVPKTPVAEVPAAADKPVQKFKTGKAFWLASRRAVALEADAARWRALRRLGLRRSEKDLARAWANATASRIDREWPFVVLQKIFEDWLSSDPDSLAAFVLGLPFDFSTDYHLVVTLGAAAQAWGETDPGAAAAFLRRLPRDYRVSEFAQVIELRARFRSDPDAFIAWLKALPAKSQQIYEATRVAVAEWATKDPRDAVSWIGRQSGPTQETALQTIAHTWVTSRPWIQKSLTALELSKDVALAGEALTDEFLAGVAELDPDWTAEKALTWKDKIFRPLVLASLSRLAQENPSAAARMVETLPFDAWTIKAVDAVAQPWARSDPQAALDWLRRQPFKSLHEHEAVGILRLWSATDPESALRAAESMSEAARLSVRANVVEMMVQKDPAAAVRHCESMSTPPPDVTLGGLAASWAPVDLDAALAWARSLPRITARDAALAGIATAPLEDSDRALAIAAEISSADERHYAINRIITETADGNPQAAAEALKRFPESLDQTVQPVARHFARLDPAAGMAWAATLPEDHRLNIQKIVMIDWANRKDAETARGWIAQSDLPAATRDELLGWLRRYGPKK
jgi:RNA polymerase sigma-70 factor (ECF subfamily)